MLQRARWANIPAAQFAMADPARAWTQPEPLFDSNLKGGFACSVALIDVRPVGKQRFNCLPVADFACFVKSNN
jgi:hypothetical protein